MLTRREFLNAAADEGPLNYHNADLAFAVLYTVGAGNVIVIGHSGIMGNAGTDSAFAGRDQHRRQFPFPDELRRLSRRRGAEGRMRRRQKRPLAQRDVDRPGSSRPRRRRTAPWARRVRPTTGPRSWDQDDLDLAVLPKGL
jgi:hypothetical protein